MKSYIAAALCAAGLIAGQVAYANGSENGHENGNGHHGSGPSTAIAGSDVSVQFDSENNIAAIGLVLTGCQQGAGTAGGGFGATLGGESRVCQLLRVAAAHQALGMHFEAERLVREAAREVNDEGALARASRAVGRFLRALVAPIPFVGHAA